MLRCGAALSDSVSPEEAGRRAAEDALSRAGVDRPDAALVFVTAAWGADAEKAAEAATRCLGCPATAGATAHGVLALGRELDQVPGVGVLALAGIQAETFLVAAPRGAEEELGAEIAARLDGAPTERDLVVLLPDPTSLAPARLLVGLREAVGPATVVGAAAVPGVDGRALAWGGGRVGCGGVAGLLLRGAAPPRVEVMQSCRPVTPLLTVTRTEGHWVRELDGRPALDVYRETARAPLAEDLRRAARVLLVALPRGGAEDLEGGGFVIRNVVGFAERERALAVAEPLRPGARLALALRDPEVARDDLVRALDSVAERPPAAALYLDCCARGGSFFGVEGLEAAYLDRALGGAAHVGMQGAFELAPGANGGAELLTYTGVLAVLDR